jgi:simple sugar transport system ATP-binding protein
VPEVAVSQPLVEMKAIVKSYGGVRALDGVDFHIRAGEIVALLGDNGAGKSTLIKILAGVTRPDSGEICIRGQVRRFGNARDAISAGIETIYQGAALVDQLSVARNLFLGREPTMRWLGVLPRIDRQYMHNEARSLLARMGLGADIDPAQRIVLLSGGQRQSVAIARAMFFQADLIVLDEPTNNLGVEETRRVLEFIRATRAAGRSSIFITHAITHALQVVDRVVVLRRGRVAANLEVADTNLADVEHLITD